MENKVKEVMRIAELFDDRGLDEIDAMSSSLLRALLDKNTREVESLLHELVDRLKELADGTRWLDKKAETEFNNFINNWK